MEMKQRKLLTIITESIIETLIIDDLKDLGLKGYTVTEARGEGARGKRRGEWEQNKNVKIEIICNEESGTTYLNHLNKKYYNNYAMITFVRDIEVIRGDKFS